MTEIKDSKGNQKYYEGFGTHKTASGWAYALGLPRMTVWQYLQQGLTPEQIMERRKVATVDLTESRRVGHRQLETLELMAELLDFSDYDPDGLEVNIVAGAYRHQIVWNGLIIGAYNPTTDALWLTDGNKIGLRNPYVSDQKIEHINGEWRPTIETTRRIIAKAERERRSKP